MTTPPASGSWSGPRPDQPDGAPPSPLRVRRGAGAFGHDPGMRARRVVVGLALAAVMAGVLPSGAAAGWGWPPPPGPPAAAPSTATYLHMVSTRDDTIGLGGGRTWTYVPADAEITVTADGGNIDVSVDGDTRWDLVLRPTSPQAQVTAGRHEGTARAVLTGDGRGCGDAQSVGWYQVDDVAYAGGELARLAVRFSQWCDDKDATRAMTGELRWDASAPTPPAPTPVKVAPASFWRPPAGLVPAGAVRNHLVMQSDPGDFIGRGQAHAYTGLVGQADLGALTVFHPELSWRLSMRPSDRAPDGLAAGFYPQLTDEPLAFGSVRGGFDVSGNARGCNQRSADVVIDRVDARDGVYRDIALRFEQRCELRGPALRGQLVWQSPSPTGSPGVPTGVGLVSAFGDLAVGWTAPADTGTSAITGYEIVTYLDGTAVGDTITVPADARTADLLVGAGGEVAVTVQAVNAAGAGVRADSTPLGSTRQDLGPFGSFEAVIAQQYRDFAGREATAAELDAALGQLRSGTTLAAWVAEMRNRPEWGGRRAPVTRLYSAAFLRPVDADGLTYWAERRRTGTSLGQMAQAFVSSAEFRTRYGRLTDAEFVDRIYRNVLGRAPDPGGLAFWTGRLDAGTSRGDVLIGFSESGEHRTRRAALVDVTLLTTGMLRRAPAVDEVNVGGNVEALALHFLTRAEYAERFA